MWWRRKPKFRISQIEESLRSNDASARRYAIARLVAAAEDDFALHPSAMEIFSRHLADDSDPAIRAIAVRGISTVSGRAAVRDKWTAMLNDPNPQAVADTVLEIWDPYFVPRCLELLDASDHISLQVSLLIQLGRLHDPQALPAMVKCLDNPKLTYTTLLALGDLGQPGAIPHLERFLNDQTECPIPDDRGCTVHYNQIAASSIRQIQYTVERESRK